VRNTGTFTVTQTIGGCISPASTPHPVTENPVPVVNITPQPGAICPGTTATLSVSNSPATYLWSDGTTNISTIVADSGLYAVTVTQNGCSNSDQQYIALSAVLSPPTFLSEDLCLGSSVTLNATQQVAGVSYMWNTGSTDASVTVAATGTYVVTVTGCNTVTASADITFEPCECNVVLPTAFSPNSDGVNDRFAPIYDCVEVTSMQMRVYNRWGEKVFETTDIFGSWDGTYKGKPQPMETYAYYLNVETVENSNPKSINLAGNVTIVR
jgi:gliding motility-associated-like protein